MKSSIDTKSEEEKVNITRTIQNCYDVNSELTSLLCIQCNLL